MEKLKVGLEGDSNHIVEKNDTAAVFGSGNIHVYATPMMIGLMENASMKVVDSYLEEGYSTVGIHVDVKHIGATPIGMKVKAKSKLVKIEGKKLFFDVEAYDEDKKIGEGSHTRYIINVKDFLEKIE